MEWEICCDYWTPYSDFERVEGELAFYSLMPDSLFIIQPHKDFQGMDKSRVELIIRAFEAPETLEVKE